MNIPSGYGEKFRAEFDSLPVGGDSPMAARKYRMCFYRRDYSGSRTDLTAGGSPYKLSYAKEGLFGVFTRKASFELVSDNEIPLSEFYADDENDMFVVIYEGSSYANIDFAGWLTPYNASQPYQAGKFLVKLSAQCGLGRLQDIEYDALPVLTTVHDIVYTCLLKVGYELPLWKNSNIYEESHLVNGQIPALEFDAWKNVRFHCETFIQNGQRANCLAILERFIKPNFILLQDAGVWKIQHRPTVIDFYAQTTWLKYADAADESPVVEVVDSRKSVYKTASLKPLRGMSEIIEPSQRLQEITADYGRLINRLRNGQFSSGLNSWTLSDAPVRPNPTALGDGTTENPYRIRIMGNAYEQTQKAPKDFRKQSYLNSFHSFSQSVTVKRDLINIGLGANFTISTRRDIVSLEVEYINYNLKGPLVIVQVKTVSGTFYLTSQGAWTGKIQEADITGENTFVNTGGQMASKLTKGATVSVTAVDPVPAGGTYTLTVYVYQGVPFDTPVGNSYIEYKSIRMTVEDTRTIVATKEVILAAAGSTDAASRKKKKSETIEICDQTSAHAGAGIRENALYRIDGSPTKVWKMLTATGSMRDKIQNLCARNRVRLMGAFGPGVEGDVLGEPGPLDVLQFPEMESRMDLIWKWETDRKTRTTTIKTVKLLNVSDNLSLKASWTDDNGVPFAMPDGMASFETVTPATEISLPGGSPASNSIGLIKYVQEKIAAGIVPVAKVVPRDYVENNQPTYAAVMSGDTILRINGDRLVSQTDSE